MELINLTIGNPYIRPHIVRPYDMGGYLPDEHPLEGVARMFRCIGQVSKAVPDLTIVSSAHSYPRQFAPQLAAGVLSAGISQIAGFGRGALAYPNYANDILSGGMDPKKCCTTCSKCTELMRAGSVSGCVIRDAETYLPFYQRDVLKK